MGIDVGRFERDQDAEIAAINTTPLVDVMLVLLIIFLITVPVFTTSVAVNLPRQHNEMRETRPDTIDISIDATGRIHWNGLHLPDAATLLQRLGAAAARDPQPQVQIRGDAAAEYAAVAQVVDACQRTGIGQVRFVIQPPGQAPPSGARR